MQHIGVYEAKTHLSRILDQVAHGEHFTIEKHGVPIAVLQPIEPRNRMSVTEAIEAMESFSANHTLGELTIRELIEEGRR